MTIGHIVAGVLILIGILLILGLALGPIGGLVLVGLGFILGGLLKFIP